MDEKTLRCRLYNGIVFLLTSSSFPLKCLPVSRPQATSAELTSPCSDQLWDRDEGASAQGLGSGCGDRGRGSRRGGREGRWG